MPSENVWVWILLALSRLLIAAVARECIFDNPPNIGYRSEDELHREFDGCTTIVADNITIGDLRGSLVVREVVNVTGTIIIPNNNDEWGMPVLDSVEFPDLEYLGGLDIYQVNDLQTLTFPKLKRVMEKIDIMPIEKDVNLNFKALERAGALRLHGWFADIDLYALQIVDNDLIIQNCEDCKAKDRAGRVRDNAPFVYFGRLRSVGYIKIAGVLDIGWLSDLTTIGPPVDPGNTELSTDSGARFYFNETTNQFGFNLSSLVSVDKQLIISGNIDRYCFFFYLLLHMDALKRTNASISINASHPLDVDLPLESAGSIDLEGRITSVHLPNLTPSTHLTLDSTYTCKTHTSLTDVSCPAPPKFTTAAKISMAIGIVTAVVLGICAVFLCCRRSQKREAERLRKLRTQVELADLPAYVPDPGTVVGNGEGEVVLRVDTPPPPYEARRDT
ncbi:hypothetical protein BJX65DRAFT_261504 [Aspergillus insuetus]